MVPLRVAVATSTCAVTEVANTNTIREPKTIKRFIISSGFELSLTRDWRVCSQWLHTVNPRMWSVATFFEKVLECADLGLFKMQGRWLRRHSTGGFNHFKT